MTSTMGSKDATTKIEIGKNLTIAFKKN